jgi:hypothetical protein
MRLRKGYRIRTSNREGMITNFHFKNGHRTLSYIEDDGTPWWCYKDNIDEILIKNQWVKWHTVSN